MQVVGFTYGGRFAHFLRAEATVNAMTYPYPPRTVLLGLVGAIMGFPKDTAPEKLIDARFAVGGPVPKRFWHKANMRKCIPAALGFRVKKSEKGTSKEEKNTRIPQEWLWKPAYQVWASLGEPHHHEFASRVKDGRWHFTPCLGLSEMLADVHWMADDVAAKLDDGFHSVCSAIRLSKVDVDTKTATSERLALHKLRMPREVSADRVFSLEEYVIERDGKPIPVKTDDAWKVKTDILMFL